MSRAPEFTFLMCSERSGSNLLSRMFDAHPAVCAPTPAHLVRILGENRARYGEPPDADGWRRLRRDACDLLATTVGPWRTSWTPDALDAAADGRTVGGLLRGVLRAEARAAGKAHLFLKENHLHRYLPFLRHEFPDLRVVAMVRDPRDMALSWKNSPILRGDVLRAAGVWREDQDGLRELLEADDRPHVHVLTYEDLVSAPEETLAATCAFLGLEMAPEMLAFHADGVSRRHAGCSDDWKNVARPLMRDNFAKWRTGLSDAEIAYVERACGDTMAAFGYAPASDDPRPAAELVETLAPCERHDKPGWADVPTAEKEVRARRQAVVRRIQAGERVHA